MMKTKHLFFTALFISATGCDFEDPGDDMTAPEPPPSPPVCTPFPSDDPAVPTCDSPVGAPAPAPLPTLELATGIEAVLSTDTGELTLPDSNKITYPMTIDESTNIRSINLRSANIAAAATLHIRGKYPLALVVENDFRADGVIVVEAGADLQCGDAAGKKGAGVELATRSAGGGGGGARLAPGGKGGIGVGNRAGGAGGVPLKSLPRWLSGGCAGGNGGDNVAAGGNQGGNGGAGGGAIYVYSSKKIEVIGQIRANGKGGEGGTRRAGGGGGGSGGMIFLNGRDVVLAGATPLCANGGGGGEGGYQATAGKNGKGDNGTNGLCRPVRANGGAGTRGANGGQGGARDAHPGLGAANGTVIDGIEGGAGGGGGSAGPIYIRARYSFTLAAGTTTSPDLRRLP